MIGWYGDRQIGNLKRFLSLKFRNFSELFSRTISQMVLCNKPSGLKRNYSLLCPLRTDKNLQKPYEKKHYSKKPPPYWSYFFSQMYKLQNFSVSQIWQGILFIANGCTLRFTSIFQGSSQRIQAARRILLRELLSLIHESKGCKNRLWSQQQTLLNTELINNISTNSAR